MDNRKRLSKDYMLLHLAYQAMAGVIYGFGLYMLVERGFSVGTAGLCIAIPNAITLIAQPIVSNFLDKQKKINVFHVMIFFSILVFLMFLANYFIRSAGVLLGVIFVLGMAIYATMEPLLNSISSVLTRSKVNINFGVSRACGSASYAVVCALFGVLSNSISYIIVLIGGAVFSICITFAALNIIGDYNKIDYVESEEKDEVISIKDFIKDNKTFIILFILIIGIMFGFFFIDNFALSIVENLGGTSEDMGYIQCIKALVEAVMMTQYTKIRKKISLQSMLRYSALLISVKVLATVLAPNVITVYFVQLLQGVSFAMLLPSIIELINTIMRKNEIQRGHSLHTMSFMCACLISSLVGGYITDGPGVITMMYISFGICFASCIAFSLVLPKVFKNKK